MKFETAQTGDKVIVRRSYGPDAIGEIARVTPKQVVIKTEFGSGRHFWKHNGYEVGSVTAWRSTWIVPATPELLERVTEHHARRQALDWLQKASFAQVPTKDLLRIVAELVALGAVS